MFIPLNTYPIMKKILTLLTLSLSCYFYSRSQIVHTPLSCGTEVGAVLNWNSAPPVGSNTDFNWNTAGSLTNTFTNLSGTGINATVTFSGETNTLFNWNSSGLLNTPSVASNASGGTANVLEYFTTGFNTGITITIDLNYPLQSFAFDMYHVNASGANGDQYIITATTLSNTTLYPTFTSSVNPSYIANSATGVIDANRASVVATRDQVGVNFFDAGASIKTITIQWFNCSTCSNAVHGSGLGSFEMCTLRQVLPVSLTRFTASADKTNSIVSWEANSQEDLQRYELEFSPNGTGDFQTATQVTVQHATKSQYTFTHFNIASTSTHTIFYRLKMIYATGVFAYSKIVPVSFYGNKNIKVYPTQFNKGQPLTVTIPGNSAELYEVLLLDLNGKKLQTVKLKGNTLAQIETGNLKPGTYILKITGSIIKETFKLQAL
jgi:hypothetical protein